MSNNRAVAFCTLSFLAVSLMACEAKDKGDSYAAGDSAKPAMDAPMAKHTMIMVPADGDTIAVDSVNVMVMVEGVKIVPVASATSAMVPGEGHLHLFLDKDVTPPGAPIPTGDPAIVHMGDGATAHTFMKLAKGPHRIISVFAFTDHSPDMSVASDTVNFVVK
jgi:hypothetical protein